MKYKILSIIIIIFSFKAIAPSELYCNKDVMVGAEKLDSYLHLLTNKKIGIVGNQSSMIGETHLVDSLLALKIDIRKVFSPEHGFRGKADAGEKVKSGIDSKTGLEIVSLYGSNKKPKPEQLKGLDILIFDIQDVGARFYTYISTLHYVMEACAENNIELIILDRPNPNGHYVDGPILDLKYKSFIGMHKIPIVHGMTIGEYANMVYGEKWANTEGLKFRVINCNGWDHTKFYKLNIKPSPNLPNMASIYLYPSLCLFEGTMVSVGRGTEYPFQIAGHPNFKGDSYEFIPESTSGAKHPKLEGENCKGIFLPVIGINVLQKQNELQLSWLIEFYKDLNMKESFFLKNNFINLLAGSNQLKAQIMDGKTEGEIRSTWVDGLRDFKVMRKTYLLYPDFE
jgi:uncharacterized protein YbbC (DUF1343 family)